MQTRRRAHKWKKKTWFVPVYLFYIYVYDIHIDIYLIYNIIIYIIIIGS